MAFPQIVGKLIEAGVEYYQVDYVEHCSRFYDGQGTCVVTPIPFEGLPKVEPELDVEALRNDIRDSQQNDQQYRDFTIRAMKAGVIGYIAFLRGQRVTYFGRLYDGPSLALSCWRRRRWRIWSERYLAFEQRPTEPCGNIKKRWT